MSTTNTASTHKFRRGQRCRITGGPFAGGTGRIAFDVPTIGSLTGDDWYVDIDGTDERREVRGRDIEPVEPAPAAGWVSGLKARLNNVNPKARTWTNERDRSVELPHGTVVTLVERFSFAIAGKSMWWFHHPELGVHRLISEADLIPAATDTKPDPSPTSAPPPSPALYRVEYAVTDDGTPAPEDDEGNGMPSLVTSHRAALVPIADPAGRAKLAEVLEALHDFGEGCDSFILGHVGGVPCDPYAVGDRVVVVKDGPHAGRPFHLAERTDDGQSWWMSETPGGRAYLGLHCDFFDRFERGDR